MVQITALQNSQYLQPALYESLLGFVSEDRKQRVKKFIRRKDACRSVIGEVLAKYCIAKAAGISVKTVSLHVDSFGKPLVDLDDQIHFNVSHSKSWVVCAVDSVPVGIDVEYVRRHDPDVAKRFYHPNEYAALNALPEAERNGRFFDLWTIKESYIKALGKGLSLALDSFEVMFENGTIRMKTLSQNPVMHFRQYDLGPEYRCAACSEREAFCREIRTMTPSQLVEEAEIPGAKA
jgi:4'-phosphopantetheinyl transferase